MKYTLLLTFIFTFSFFGKGQSLRLGIVTSSLTNTAGPVNKLRWSVGEIAVKQISGSENSLSPGSVSSSSSASSILRLASDNVQSTIKIYPNPAHQTLTIDHKENLQLQIYDLSGNQILLKELIDSSVDITNLLPGIYLIKLQHKNGSLSTYKFTKI